MPATHIKQRSGSGKIRALPNWAILSLKTELQVYSLCLHWQEDSGLNLPRVYTCSVHPVCYKYYTASIVRPRLGSSAELQHVSCHMPSHVQTILEIHGLWAVAISKHQPCLSCSWFSSLLQLIFFSMLLALFLLQCKYLLEMQEERLYSLIWVKRVLKTDLRQADQ